MPTYQYRCRECDHEFEAQQAFSDDPLRECPSCQGPVRKVFSAVGISFKGSGFYKTDSRSSSGSSSSSTSSDGSSSSGTSTSSDTSSSSSTAGSATSSGTSAA